MEDIFVAKDPRGYTIKCSEERWNYILWKHPELNRLKIDDLILFVKETIENPAYGFIYQSPQSKERHIYYGKIINSRVELMIVVDFRDTNNIQPISFRPCSSRNPGEKVIWPKLSQ